MRSTGLARIAAAIGALPVGVTPPRPPAHCVWSVDQPVSVPGTPPPRPAGCAGGGAAAAGGAAGVCGAGGACAPRKAAPVKTRTASRPEIADEYRLVRM